MRRDGIVGKNRIHRVSPSGRYKSNLTSNDFPRPVADLFASRRRRRPGTALEIFLYIYASYDIYARVYLFKTALGVLSRGIIPRTHARARRVHTDVRVSIRRNIAYILTRRNNNIVRRAEGVNNDPVRAEPRVKQ